MSLILYYLDIVLPVSLCRPLITFSFHSADFVMQIDLSLDAIDRRIHFRVSFRDE